MVFIIDWSKLFACILEMFDIKKSNTATIIGFPHVFFDTLLLVKLFLQFSYLNLFFAPHARQRAIFSNEKHIYWLAHQLPNDLGN